MENKAFRAEFELLLLLQALDGGPAGAIPALSQVPRVEGLRLSAWFPVGEKGGEFSGFHSVTCLKEPDRCPVNGGRPRRESPASGQVY